MEQELIKILVGIVGLAVVSILGWVAKVITNFLNKNLKDKEGAKLITGALSVVTDSVQEVYQEFVEVLKKSESFDKDAQNEAKERATKIIKENLTEDMKKYVVDNCGDIESWISRKIETTIYELKNK